MTTARDTWESIALADTRLKLEALLTVKALARLADDGCELHVSKRSLADAMGRKDSAGHSEAVAQRGLDRLRRLGYVLRLNPDAPRRERGHYLLTVPAVMLAA